MFCDKCGTENRESAEFCSNCGSKMSGNAGKKSQNPTQNKEVSKPASFIERFKQSVSDRYEIIRELGRGGMAIVFLAKDKRLEREVALKLLPEEFHHDEKFRTRFIREARVSAKLSHPNIIQIHDVNEKGDFTYFSMSYIQGVPLAKILEKGESFDPKIIARLVIHVCFALQHAHENNVIHRDIKPENILINKKKMPIVVDFGIAKALSETKLSQTGMLIGTPHYMSPEQIKTGEVDGRSDIYSLGILMYEMAVGKTPFKGLDPTALMYHQVNEVPKPPHDLNENVPEDFSDLIMKSLEKNPNNRYQTAAELGKALHHFIQGAATGAPKAGADKKEPAAAASVKQTPESAKASETVVTRSGAQSAETQSEDSGESLGDTLVSPAVLGKMRSTDDSDEESSSGIGVVAGAIGIVSILIITGLLGLQLLNNDDEPEPERQTVERQKIQPSQSQQERPQSTAPGLPQSAETKPESEPAPAPTRPQRESAPEPSPPVTEPRQQASRPAKTQQTQIPSQPALTTPRQVSPERQTTQPAATETPSERPPVSETPSESLQQQSSTAQKQIASVPRTAPEPEQPASVSVPERTAPAPQTSAQPTATMTWMKIPRGTFEMGDSRGDMPEEMLNRPVHRVTLSDFEMSRDEVTVQQYAVFLDATNNLEPLNWKVQLKFSNRPVVFVSWNDAAAFAEWVGGRLPTEAEWEYAARGGQTGKMYPWGDNSPENRANFNNDWENGNGWVRYLKDVGSYPPNNYGLNDMAGNVYEWCYDWFGPYTNSLVTNPTGAASSNYGRVVRGGGWNSGSRFIRNSVRGPRNPDDRVSHTGFRVVRGRLLN